MTNNNDSGVLADKQRFGFMTRERAARCYQCNSTIEAGENRYWDNSHPGNGKRKGIGPMCTKCVKLLETTSVSAAQPAPAAISSEQFDRLIVALETIADNLQRQALAPATPQAESKNRIDTAHIELYLIKSFLHGSVYGRDFSKHMQDQRKNAEEWVKNPVIDPKTAILEARKQDN